MKTLTQTRLKEVLDYDPETGIFTAKITCGQRKAGERVGTITDGHIRISIDRVNYMAHNLAWFYVYGVLYNRGLDHKDRNGFNNRIDNLRETTNSQNQMNKGLSSLNTSGIKGVSFVKKTQKWRADIRINRKGYYLGSFDDKFEAALAYTVAANSLFGEFANP